MESHMSNTTMSETEAKWKSLLAGVEAAIPARSSLMIDGVSTTQGQMVSTLEDGIALFDAATTAKTAATSAVAAMHAGLPAVEAFVRDLTIALKQFFGANSPELAQFGIALPKPRAEPSAGKKALASARRANTRQTRGTLWKNQRAAIQPNVVPLRVTLGPDGKPVKTAAAAAAPAGGSTGTGTPSAS
jgi:hypothetical protein